MLRDQGDMDRDFYERVVKEMREAGVEELGMFYLGESFLCKWLPEAIQYAKEVGFPYVFCTTNASVSTPERVEACMLAGLDSLKFSFNYADEEQFTEISGMKPRLFSRMKENIRKAHEVRAIVEATTGHRCGLYASYIEYDGLQGEKMFDAVEEIRPYVDQVYALPLYNQADLVTSKLDADWKPIAGNRGRVGALRDPFHMADLNEVGFLEGWNSVAFQELRRAHLKKDVTGTVCEGCVAYA
jgi:hypothetical protein